MPSRWHAGNLGANALPDRQLAMDDLERFADWYLHRSSPLGFIPLHDAVSYISGVTAVLLYRDGPYQVQMFVVPPNHIIPEHTHPNVDSMEVYIGGQIRFSHSGKFVITEDEFLNPAPLGLPKMRGKTIRVLPSDLHGGVFGPSGGVFISIQHWINGVDPHCVSADYDGVVMGEDHLKKVKFGKAFMKDSLNAKDAAWQE